MFASMQMPTTANRYPAMLRAHEPASETVSVPPILSTKECAVVRVRCWRLIIA